MKGDDKYENYNSWRDHMERHSYIHHLKFMAVLEVRCRSFPNTMKSITLRLIHTHTQTHMKNAKALHEFVFVSRHKS